MDPKTIIALGLVMLVLYLAYLLVDRWEED